MIFSQSDIDALGEVVEERLSKRRYAHTLGVVQAAEKIALLCGFDDVSEIKAAALLHDISKEYTEAEQLMIADKFGILISRDDSLSPAVIHSLTAPCVIKSEFPFYATQRVLSAVYNHTLGSADMSVFDEIIFIADYVEEGRSHSDCVRVRRSLFSDLSLAITKEDAIMALHRAVLSSLESTIRLLRTRGDNIHPKTLAAYDFFAKYKSRNNI